MSIDSLVELIQLPVFNDSRGGLLVVENDNSTFPFAIKRTYLIYDVPSNKIRAGHAHKNLNQLLIASSGSFTIRVQDGIESRDFTLDKPSFGLLIRPGIWRDLFNFSKNSTCLVFADSHYDDSDYIRNFEEYTLWKSQATHSKV